MKSLAASLELATSRDNVYGNEKEKLNHHIVTLQGELADVNKTVSSISQDNDKLKEAVHLYSEKSKLFDELVPKYQLLRQEKDELLEKMRILQEAHELLSSERDSMSILVEQKDSLLWMQNQQSENAIKLLQQQLQQQAVSQSKADDLYRLQESLQDLFSNEGDAVYSELLDAKKLAVMVKELRDKMHLYSMLSQQFEKDAMMKKELEKRVVESVTLLKDEEQLRELYEKELCASLHQGHQLVDKSLFSTLENSKHFDAEWYSSARMKEQPADMSNQFGYQHFDTNTSTARSTHVFSSLLPNETKQRNGMEETNDVEGDDTVVHLVSQLELARSEVAYLTGQLEASQKENQNLRESLSATQTNMQREFSSLWLSVQELNKLDALKDKSIEELIKERENLKKERDMTMEREEKYKIENDHLRRELQVTIDFFLIKELF